MAAKFINIVPRRKVLFEKFSLPIAIEAYVLSKFDGSEIKTTNEYNTITFYIKENIVLFGTNDDTLFIDMIIFNFLRFKYYPINSKEIVSELYKSKILSNFFNSDKFKVDEVWLSKMDFVWNKDEK